MPRRCQCALPGCSEKKRVFPTIKEGRAHLGILHGIKPPWPTYEDGLVILDPPNVHYGRRGRTRDFAPTTEEYERLLDAARDEADRVFFLVLGESGLRSSELRHLRPSWLWDGTLHVPYRDPEMAWKAKTKQAARAVPLRRMNGEAWDILEDWCARPARWKPDFPLGISAFALWERVRNGGRRAGLSRRLFPHALRSYCATKWAYNLGSPFVLMDLMGWSSPKVAIAYVRSTGRGLEDAVMAWNHNGSNGAPPAPCIHDSNGGTLGGSVPYAGSLRLT